MTLLNPVTSPAGRSSWRQRVNELYDAVRAKDNPERVHPVSPARAAARARRG
jgi:hypothetical protein